MAPGRSRPFYEKFRWEMILIYIGGGILLLGTTLFSYYTQNWVTQLDSVEIWALIGFCAVMAGAGAWGLVAAFRQDTAKAMAGNRLFEVAFPKPEELSVDYFTLDPSWVQTTLPDTEREEFESAKKIVPGQDGYGQRVRTAILGFGGVDAHGVHSFHSGQDGFFVMHGDDQIIHTKNGMFIPYDLEMLDHSRVEQEVVTALKDHPNFVRNRTVFFVAGSLNSGVHRWLSTSPTAHQVVLQQMGLYGLAHRFALHLAGLVKANHIPGLPDGYVTPEVTRLLERSLVDWLKTQPRLAMAAGHGHAGAEYWRSKYYGLLSHSNYNDARLATLEDALLNATNLTASILGRKGAIAGISSHGPVHQIADGVPTSRQDG